MIDKVGAKLKARAKATAPKLKLGDWDALVWDAFVAGDENAHITADFDQYVQILSDKNLIAEESKHNAILEFRVAVMTAAATARGVELTEKNHNEAIASAKRNLQEIEKIRHGLQKFDKNKFASPDQIGDVLAAQRALMAADRALEEAAERYKQPASGRARNWRNHNVFRRTFVNNLKVEWKRLTVARAPGADFERFVEAAFAFVGIECPDSGPGRYINRRF